MYILIMLTNEIERLSTMICRFCLAEQQNNCLSKKVVSISKYSYIYIYYNK